MSRIPHQQLPAGAFADWLAQTHDALTRGGDIDVPCGDCTACCESRYFIHIAHDETETIAAIPKELLVPAPGREGYLVLGYDEHGACPMLRDGRCTIYAHRPKTCRQYDCRVFAAAGIEAGDADKRAVNARVERWAFDETSPEDARQRAAVAAAARYLSRNPECLPGGGLANPTQLALSAIRVHDLFLRDPAPTIDAVKAVLQP